MEKIKDEVIQELKQIMEKKKLSAGTMARLIGCDSSQIGRWISGKSRPTLVYQLLIRKGINRAKSL